MSHEQTNKMVYLEFDGFHHWEKYLMTYSQALALIPVLLPKVPTLILTDYDNSKIQRDNSENNDSRFTLYENNENTI
jgi:hypothetical protein